MPRFVHSLQNTDPGLLAPRGEESKPPDLERLEKLDTVLKRWEENFSHNVKLLGTALNYYAATESVALLGLLSNLDWNRDWMAS